MNLLEDLYSDILINERLAQINISSDMIQKALNKEYKAYRERMMKLHPEKTITFPKQQNDERVMKNILALVYDQDTTFERIIDNYIKTEDINQLQKAVAMTDQRWRYNISKSEESWFFRIQPLNLAFMSILKRIGLLNFPIRYNEEGWPQYPKHLLNKFIAMNILEQRIKAKTITPEQKATIDSVIFDEQTANMIKQDIQEYIKRTQTNVSNETEESAESETDQQE
jgi:hypothetical protein